MPTLSAVSYGPEALALAGESGEIRGVSSKGVYLHARNGALVGLVDASGVDGPVTIRVQGLNGALDVLKHSHGRPFSGDGSTLRIDGKVEIDLRQARRWTPPVVQAEGDVEAIGRATQGLWRQWRVASGEWLVLVPGLATDHRPLTTAIQTLLRAWRAGKVEDATEAAVKLLGLGPGLTPSGDDVLAGLLAATLWADSGDRGSGIRDQARRPTPIPDPRSPIPAMRAVVAEAVVAEAPSRTTSLSARLLAYAADGILYEPAMNLGVALFAGRIADIEPAAQRLFGLGHTSGTDMALGIALGIVLSFEF